MCVYFNAVGLLWCMPQALFVSPQKTVLDFVDVSKLRNVCVLCILFVFHMYIEPKRTKGQTTWWKYASMIMYVKNGAERFCCGTDDFWNRWERISLERIPHLKPGWFGRSQPQIILKVRMMLHVPDPKRCRRLRAKSLYEYKIPSDADAGESSPQAKLYICFRFQL